MAKPEVRKAQPISRHPLFPAIVALWFAALFGVGSIIVSPSLLERIVAATGLAKLVPMAAPPLGTTARILFALALTGLGGLIGLLAGRRVAQTAEEAPPRMPFAGLENDPADRAAETATPDAREVQESAPALPRRRRASSLVADDVPPLEEQEAEYPAGDPSPILNLSELDLEGIEAAGLADPQLPPAHQAYLRPTLDGGRQQGAGSLESVETFSAERLANPDIAPAAEGVIAEAPSAEIEHAARDTDAQGPFGRIPEWLEQREEAHSFSPAAWAKSPDDVAEPVAPTVAPEDLSNRLFEAYSRSLSAQGEAREVRPLFARDPADGVSASPAAAEPHAAERIAAADLEDLSHIQLLERLALAMEQERRRTTAAGQNGAELDGPAPSDRSADTPEIPLPNFATLAFSAAESPLPRLASIAPFAAPLRPVEDGQAEAGDFVRSATPRIPAGLRPVAFDAFAHDDGDETLPGYVPPRHISLAAPLSAQLGSTQEPNGTTGEVASDRPASYMSFDSLSADLHYAEAAEDDEEDAVLAKGYSSLLNLTRAAPRQSFVRLENADSPGGELSEPVGSNDHRPFDPPSHSDPDETDKALRAALATLQRMSGAA